MRVVKILVIGLVLGGFLRGGESFGAALSHTTRTVSGAGVAVKVTPVDPETSNDLRFQVIFDAHPVNLDGYDLKTITVLRDDTGKNYLPTEVENKGGGHHREVTVIFPKIAREAKSFEVVIKDVGGMKERTFRWDLQ